MRVQPAKPLLAPALVIQCKPGLPLCYAGESAQVLVSKMFDANSDLLAGGLS